MQILDRLASWAIGLKTRSSVVFPEGWGDRLMLESLIDPMPEEHTPADVVWQAKTEHRGFRRTRGLFTSPVASILGEAMAVVPVEKMEPPGRSRKTVVLLPAWNEEGLDRRRSLGSELATRGVTSMFAEVPFYGARRASDRPSGMPIRTVADFALMGRGAVVETCSLLALAEEGGHACGVGGFSMGANLASLATASWPRPLAIGLMAPSASPGPVFLDGALSRGIAWKTLGGRSSRPELSTFLHRPDALSVASMIDRSNAVLVAGRRDGFVPAEASRRLAEAWSCELRWLDTGHAGLHLRHRSSLVDAIVDSFDKLSAVRPPELE